MVTAGGAVLAALQSSSPILLLVSLLDWFRGGCLVEMRSDLKYVQQRALETDLSVPCPSVQLLGSNLALQAPMDRFLPRNKSASTALPFPPVTSLLGLPADAPPVSLSLSIDSPPTMTPAGVVTEL